MTESDLDIYHNQEIPNIPENLRIFDIKSAGEMKSLGVPVCILMMQCAVKQII